MPYRSRWSSVERAKRSILTLPQALHEAARAYPGGATAIAAVEGHNPTTFNHKLSLTNNTHTPNIHDMELVLDLTRDPRIVDAILHPIGWVGVDVSDLRETDTPQALLASLGDMLKREGELINQLTKALADDHLNCDELAEFEQLAERLVQGVFKLGAVVRRKHEEGRADG